MRNAYNILVEKSEGKTTLGKHKSRWKENIKPDLKEIKYKNMH
jgi:hypothetical protein